jgi:NitT/TauT family transport system substrate-binding protein
VRNGFRSLAVLAVTSGLWMGQSALSPPPKATKLAFQEGGAASLETAAMRELNLDETNWVKLRSRNVADSLAGQVALQAGEGDEGEMIISEFVWTSLQRDRGGDWAVVPDDLSVGGNFARSGGAVRSTGDLEGAIAAAAVERSDKRVLSMQANYNVRAGLDLSRDTETNFEVSPLFTEQLSQGQEDAILNFWRFNARTFAAGASQIISAQVMLNGPGACTTPPPLCWAFLEIAAADHWVPGAVYLCGLLQTKQALRPDDALWDNIRVVMNADDDELFSEFGDAYRVGAVRSSSDADVQLAKNLVPRLRSVVAPTQPVTNGHCRIEESGPVIAT